MAIYFMSIMIYMIIGLSILSALGIIFSTKTSKNIIFISSVAFILILITLTFTAQPSNYIALKLFLFSLYPISLFAGFLYLEKDKIKLSKVILLLVLLITFLIFL